MFQPQPTPYAPSFAWNGASSNEAIAASFGYQSSYGLGHNSGGGPILFSNPTNKPPSAGSVPNFRPTNRSLRQHPIMASMENGHDLAAQQSAAGQYHPELKGPLVGNRKSSHAITEEYAKADPVYVAKTSALPRTYSHYRPILGDGNCGWRAIVFSYFETLQKLGDKDLLENERNRMLAFGNWITGLTGYDGWLWEDMREEVLALLIDISNLNGTGLQPDDSSLVLQRLNDRDISNQMMYWFRLLASTLLCSDPERYSGFIPEGMSVDAYRKQVLEPPDQHIDHLGMSLLIDVLLKPIGVAVEVVYLDRSEGTQVNVHMFQELDANELPVHPAGPIIHLLYRPGHYDILYKDGLANFGLRQQQVLDEALANPNIQVNRVSTFVHHHENEPTPMQGGGQLSVDDFALMMNLPGFSMVPPNPSGYTSDYDPFAGASYGVNPSAASISASPISPVSPMAPSPMFSNAGHGLPIHSIPSYHSASKSSSSTIGTIDMDSSPSVQFRPSRFELEPDWKDTPAPTCQTATFKNSPFNKAHYNNPDFQPEEYVPDSYEVVVGRPVRKREGSSRSN